MDFNSLTSTDLIQALKTTKIYILDRGYGNYSKESDPW